MTTLFYAFSNQWATNISRHVLSALQEQLGPPRLPAFGGLREGIGMDFLPVYFHPRAFFKKYVENSHYSLVIGLGDFFGQSDKIRLETIAHNIYGHEAIYPFSPINLDLSLPPLDQLDTHLVTVSEHMGKYNCNWMAYSIELYIRQHAPHTKQLFLHLPKSQNATNLASQIMSMLTYNNVLSYS